MYVRMKKNMNMILSIFVCLFVCMFQVLPEVVKVEVAESQPSTDASSS